MYRQNARSTDEVAKAKLLFGMAIFLKYLQLDLNFSSQDNEDEDDDTD